jgi:hypothetical protein
MSFFLVVGFFALANRGVPGVFSFFDTSIMCAGNPDRFRSIFAIIAADKAPIADSALVCISAKAFSPGHIIPEDFLFDTVDIDIFPGDPRVPTYDEHMPAPRALNVHANGTVTDSQQSSGDSIVTFLITVSEFVQNSHKQSVIL